MSSSQALQPTASPAPDADASDAPSASEVEIMPIHRASEKAIKLARYVFNTDDYVFMFSSFLGDEGELRTLAGINQCCYACITGQWVRFELGHELGNFLSWALGKKNLQAIAQREWSELETLPDSEWARLFNWGAEVEGMRMTCLPFLSAHGRWKTIGGRHTDHIYAIIMGIARMRPNAPPFMPRLKRLRMRFETADALDVVPVIFRGIKALDVLELMIMMDLRDDSHVRWSFRSPYVIGATAQSLRILLLRVKPHTLRWFARYLLPELSRLCELHLVKIEIAKGTELIEVCQRMPKHCGTVFIYPEVEHQASFSRLRQQPRPVDLDGLVLGPALSQTHYSILSTMQCSSLRVLTVYVREWASDSLVAEPLLIQLEKVTAAIAQCHTVQELYLIVSVALIGSARLTSKWLVHLARAGRMTIFCMTFNIQPVTREFDNRRRTDIPLMDWYREDLRELAQGWPRLEVFSIGPATSYLGYCAVPWMHPDHAECFTHHCPGLAILELPIDLFSESFQWLPARSSATFPNLSVIFVLPTSTDDQHLHRYFFERVQRKWPEASFVLWPMHKYNRPISLMENVWAQTVLISAGHGYLDIANRTMAEQRRARGRTLEEAMEDATKGRQ